MHYVYRMFSEYAPGEKEKGLPPRKIIVGTIDFWFDLIPGENGAPDRFVPVTSAQETRSYNRKFHEEGIKEAIRALQEEKEGNKA